MLRLMLLKFSVSTWFAPGHAFPLSVSHFAIPAKWFFRHISVHGTFPKFLANFRWSLLNLLCFLKQSPFNFIFVGSKKKKKKNDNNKKHLVDQLMYFRCYQANILCFPDDHVASPFNLLHLGKQTILLLCNHIGFCCLPPINSGGTGLVKKKRSLLLKSYKIL